MLTFPCVAVLVLCSVVGVIGVLRSIFVSGKMLDEVNAMLPEAQRIRLAPFDRWKHFRVVAEYRRLYPSGPRLRQLRSVDLAMFFVGAVAAYASGLGLDVAALFGIGGAAAIWFMYRNGRPPVEPPPILAPGVETRPTDENAARHA